MAKSKSPGKWLVIIFYMVFIGGTGLVTYVAVEWSRDKTSIGSKFFPHLQCVGIDENPVILLAQERGAPINIRLAGVWAPSESQSQLNGLNPANEDRISRKTLLAYIYKRRIRFHAIEGVPEYLSEGLKQGYVELYGVDVGKQLLQNGQGFANDQDHPRRDVYLAAEEEARSKRHGVWRLMPED